MADIEPPTEGLAESESATSTTAPPAMAHPSASCNNQEATKSAETNDKDTEENTVPDTCPIQEHEPLVHLLRCLPQRVQKGLFSMDIDYTCLDVSREYIAVGSTIGIVFLYDRLAQTLQKLKCPGCQSPGRSRVLENPETITLSQRLLPASRKASPICVLQCTETSGGLSGWLSPLVKNKQEVITCVRMRQGVDYVVAAGTADGRVYIFQLPSFLPGRAKQLQMFCVEGLHVGKIMCLEWSPNTEKLFSGDQDGNVISTEIDYTQNQSKSFTFCQEPHPVIQLSYAHRTLLVSTTFRSVVCNNSDEKRVKKIGTKDRKILGDFGACFMPGSYKSEDAVVYCARPGLRLWRATIEATVEMTYMFRDLLHGKTNLVPILPDTHCEPTRDAIEEVNFGKLYVLGERHLVTFSGNSLFVLDPAGRKLLGWANNLGEIVDLAVSAEEVFFLRRDSRRRIIRLASQKDLLNEPLPSSEILPSGKGGLPHSPVHLFQHTAEMMQSGLMAALQGVTEKIQEGQQLVGSSSSSTAVPPWGYAQGPRRTPTGEEGEVDSCKEASSASSVSSSMHDELGSPVSPESQARQKADKSGTGSLPANGSKSAQLSQTQGELPAEQSQPQPQPEIHLESDDVISVHIPHTDDGLAAIDSCSNKMGSDSSGYATSGQSSGSGVKTVGGGLMIEKLNAITNDDSDIVFSPKPRKQKKKKPKSQTSKRLVEDTISIDSLEVSSIDSGADGRSPSSSPVPDSSAQDEQDSVTPVVTSTSETKSNKDSLRGEPSSSAPDSKSGKSEESKGSSVSDTTLPPVQKLSELGVVGIKIEPKEKVRDQPKTSQSESLPGPTVSSGVEVKTERPKSLPTVSSRSSDSIISDSVLFGRKTSSPTRFEPFRPPYERSTSSTTDPDATSITSASNISASFHEDMNNASFESYARNNSEIEETETPSPQKENRQKFYQSPDSSDDFYSKYQHSASSYSLDDIYSPMTQDTLEEALDYSSAQEPGSLQGKWANSKDSGSSKTRPADLSLSTEETDALDVHHQFSDTWTEMLAPGNLQSMCLTDRHIWVVDKSDRLHYSSLSGPGLTWRKVDESARQIAVSRSGSIVWRLHQGSVYAGTKITTRAPAGLNWVEVLRKDVAFIAVDETMAWYIKSNGDVMVQKGLSRDRPSFRSVKVPTKLSLKQICCLNGVVWAVTDAQEIVYRTGTSPTVEGDGWEKLEGENLPEKVSSLAFGEEGTAWVIDNAARVWFTTGVGHSQPTGTKKWWEVSISEYIMADHPTTLTVRQIAEVPLSRLVTPSSDVGGLITVGRSGVWVSRGFKHVLHICRGSLLGHSWSMAGPSGMAQSAQWHIVSASAATKTDGMVWTQQPNGAIFAFPPQKGKVTEVSQPRQDMSPFSCLSAAPESVWGLTKEGQVYIRTGMASHCPHGLNWVCLDLMQLGGAQLVHLSCGSQNVWAVDAKGMVYLRIGNRPPDSKHLNPAWVPVEGTTHQSGAKFAKVFTGSLDWMVWAVDSKKCVYVRKGVTDSMPIGTHWLYVPGTPAEELALSERLVYAVTPTGELMIRYNVLEDSPAGDYWKRVPGAFRTISVTAGDNLWGVNLEGQLCYRTTNFIKRKETESAFTPTRVNVTISDDWEVI